MRSRNYDDPDAYELSLAATVRRRREREESRCQCDGEYGTCPGPKNCVEARHEEGEACEA